MQLESTFSDSGFRQLISNYIDIKSQFVPILASSYEIEQHYYGKSFKNSFEMIKKLIYDMATEKDEVEYDIIVKRRKIEDLQSAMIQRSSSEIRRNFFRFRRDDRENKKMHRHKNCPKLFGKTFFGLVVNNPKFKKKHITIEKINRKAVEINYPEVVELKITPEEFIKWVKSEEYDTKYTNLKVFREIWQYKSPPDSGAVDKDWQVRHYKFILTTLMKIFFEEYAYNYVIKSNIMNENGEQYLNLIPKFISGMESPETFLCLLD